MPRRWYEIMGPSRVPWLSRCIRMRTIMLAKVNGMKAIRLNALASNTPAHRLYEHLGFEYRGKQHLFAENTSWTDFFFFEYNEFIS